MLTRLKSRGVSQSIYVKNKFLKNCVNVGPEGRSCCYFRVVSDL